MPLYVYECVCGARFEELMRLGDGSATHKCTSCAGVAHKCVSAANHCFGESSAGDGNSGVTAVDGNLDMLIGRSAARRWQQIEKVEADKSAIRRQTGASFLRRAGDGSYQPVPEPERQIRDKVARQHNRARRGEDGWVAVGSE